MRLKLVRLCGPELENEATSCASIYNIHSVVWRPSDPYEGTMSSVAWLHYEQSAMWPQVNLHYSTYLIDGRCSDFGSWEVEGFNHDLKLRNPKT